MSDKIIRMAITTPTKSPMVLISSVLFIRLSPQHKPVFRNIAALTVLFSAIPIVDSEVANMLQYHSAYPLGFFECTRRDFRGFPSSPERRIFLERRILVTLPGICKS